MTALSIVSTLYQSASHVRSFYERCTATAHEFCGDDYEIVLVNDGSPDDSLEIAIDLAHHDPHVRVIDLSRNFGHHKAMMTGLAHAHGTSIFLIDSDLEESPEWLVSFDAARGTADVAFGFQEQRRGNLLARLLGSVYYSVFRVMTGIPLPDNIVTARLMSRRYVDALLLHEEREIVIAGLWHLTGFEQRAVPVTKGNHSPTTYDVRRRAAMMVDSITSFSSVPLVAIFYLGMLILFFSVCYAAYLGYRTLFLADPPGGWTSTIVSIWLLGGLITSLIGVVGIYLAKIYSEIKRRPNTIVRSIYPPQEPENNAAPSHLRDR